MRPMVLAYSPPSIFIEFDIFMTKLKHKNRRELVGAAVTSPSELRFKMI